MSITTLQRRLNELLLTTNISIQSTKLTIQKHKEKPKEKINNNIANNNKKIKNNGNIKE